MSSEGDNNTIKKGEIKQDNGNVLQNQQIQTSKETVIYYNLKNQKSDSNPNEVEMNEQTSLNEGDMNGKQFMKSLFRLNEIDCQSTSQSNQETNNNMIVEIQQKHGNSYEEQKQQEDLEKVRVSEEIGKMIKYTSRVNLANAKSQREFWKSYQSSLQECKQRFDHFNEEIHNELKELYIKLRQNNCYLQKKIAEGGEGKLYEGIYYETNKEELVVFKIIKHFDNVKSEVDIMKQFDNDNENDGINLMKFLKWIVIEGINGTKTNVFVMERYTKNLEQELKEMKEFSETKLSQIFMDLLDGLIQLRVFKILHLDIKPSNILVSIGEFYYYSDFGISLQCKSDEVTHVLGYTKHFASPEQQNCSLNTNFKADVYSLGKTFQVVIKCFKALNPEDTDLIKSIEQLIEENMINESKDDRFDCLQLHQSFFKIFLTQKESQYFRASCYIKINLIKESYLFSKKKDIEYNLDLRLYYLNMQKYLFETLIQTDPLNSNIYLELGYHYDVIGQYSKALKYSLLNLEMSEKSNKRSKRLDIAQTLYDIGRYYFILLDFQIALEYFLQSCTIYKELYRNGERRFALTLNMLGNVYLALGDKQNAFQYFQQTLNMQKQLLREYHPDLIQSLYNIGRLYLSIEDFRNGLQCLHQSLNIFKINQQEETPVLAQILFALGIVYHELRDYKNAIKYSLQALEIAQFLFKKDHPDTEKYLTLMLSIYISIGDLQIAQIYALQSFNMRTSIFKGNNPEISESLNILFYICFRLRDYKSALDYAHQELKMSEQLDQREPLNVVNSLFNISNSLIVLGDQKMAIQYCLQYLEILEKSVKGYHQLKVETYEKIASLLHTLGDYEQALTYTNQSLQMYQSHFQGDHYFVAKSLFKLSFRFSQCKKLEAALKNCFLSLQMFDRLSKKDDEEKANCLSFIGNYFNQARNFQEAFKYNQLCLQMRERIFQKDHIAIASSLYDLGNSYHKLNDLKKGIECTLRALKIEQNHIKGNHPSIANSLNNISALYEMYGDQKSSLQYSLQSFQMYSQIFKGDHHQICLSLYRLAASYFKNKDPNNALKYALQCLEMKQRMSQEYGPGIAISQQQVSEIYRSLGDTQNQQRYNPGGHIQAIPIFRRFYQ